MSATTPGAASLPGPDTEAPPARKVGALLLMPSVIVLLAWMIVPLVLTLWFSFQYYNLVDPTANGFAGIDNYAVPGNRSRFLGFARKYPDICWLPSWSSQSGSGPCWRCCSTSRFLDETSPACWRSPRSSSCPRSAR